MWRGVPGRPEKIRFFLTRRTGNPISFSYFAETLAQTSAGAESTLMNIKSSHVSIGLT